MFKVLNGVKKVWIFLLNVISYGIISALLALFVGGLLSAIDPKLSSQCFGYILFCGPFVLLALHLVGLIRKR